MCIFRSWPIMTVTHAKDREPKLWQQLLLTTNSSIKCFEEGPSILWRFALSSDRRDERNMLLLCECIERNGIHGRHSRCQPPRFRPIGESLRHFLGGSSVRCIEHEQGRCI